MRRLRDQERERAETMERESSRSLKDRAKEIQNKKEQIELLERNIMELKERLHSA